MASKFSYPTSFRNAKYPDFIRSSVFLKAYPKPVKVFPRIGLPNSEVSLSKVSPKGFTHCKFQIEKIHDILSVTSANLIVINNDIDDFEASLGDLFFELDDDNWRPLVRKVGARCQIF